MAYVPAMTATFQADPAGTAKYSVESAAILIDEVVAVGLVPKATQQMTSVCSLTREPPVPKAADCADVPEIVNGG